MSKIKTNAKMPTQKFATLGLAAMTAFYTQEQKKKLNALVAKLQAFAQKKGYALLYESVLGNALEIKANPQDCLLLKPLARQCDIVLALGGDGNMLRCARALVDTSTPLLGFNLGNLGFLTDLKDDQISIDALDSILQGHYQTSYHRPLLAQDSSGVWQYAINEITVRSSFGIGSFQVFSEGSILIEQDADGLIFSTPIGSTGHALSAGGPIVHPHVDMLSVIPICAHHLNARPLILPMHLNLTIKLSTKSRSMCLWSFDGRKGGDLNSQDDSLCITHAPMESSVTFIHPLSYSFLKNYREKLS